MKKSYKILIVILLLSMSIKAQSRNDAGLQGDAGATSGFFDANVPVNFPVGATSWWHLLDVRHSNTNNNFAMQFAGSFFNQELFFRKTNDNPTTGWSKVLLETDGKVGIGTNNPSNRFEVSGSTFNRAAFVTTENAQTGLMVQRNQSNGAFNTAWELYSPLSSTDLRLFNVDDRITFQSNGNVGIGTTDPKGYKLAVAGNMIAESVKVQLRGSWADYVFDEEYDLPKLRDIEAFVKKNKHLPEIPSAEEVKSQGIDLGQMNEKLLKKIEELTLHLIEQEKRASIQNQKLQNQISAQQLQIEQLEKRK